MGIGKNIEMLRKLNKMTQCDLGKRLNVSNKTVSSWEKDRTEPNIGMIEAMCDIFNCQKTDLIDGVKSDNNEHSIKLSDEEFELILNVRKLNERDKGFYKRLWAYIKALGEI